MNTSFEIGPSTRPPFAPMYMGDEPDHPTPKPKKEGEDKESKEEEADE